MSDSGSFELKEVILATATQVLFGFVDPNAIKKWWGASNVVVQSRPGGIVLIQWDDGPLIGTLGGVLDNSQAGHFVHFGALHWMSQGVAVGPWRLEVDLVSKNDPRQAPTLLKLRGSTVPDTGAADFLEKIQASLRTALPKLKDYCENEAPAQSDQRIMGLGDSYLAEAVLQRRRIS